MKILKKFLLEQNCYRNSNYFLDCGSVKLYLPQKGDLIYLITISLLAEQKLLQVWWYSCGGYVLLNFLNCNVDHASNHEK